MKKVLITGRNSYIGNRLAAWLALWPEEYQVDKVSLQTDKWQDIDWSGYDSIIHVAGIAHNSLNKSLENLYHSVNRDLTEYCGRFLPVVRFFLPLFAGRFTNVCGIVYQ